MISEYIYNESDLQVWEDLDPTGNLVFSLRQADYAYLTPRQGLDLAAALVEFFMSRRKETP